MKKVVILASMVVVGGGVYFQLSKESSNVAVNKSTNPAAMLSSAGTFRSVDACSVLTMQDAISQLGDGAKKGDSTAGNAGSDDLAVSNCIYYTTSTSTSGYRSVSLLARAAKTKDGSTSNISQFKDLKPPAVKDVSGIGDAAFWNPDTGQLNVLVGDNWYIISNGSSRANERKQLDAVAIATRILPKL